MVDVIIKNYIRGNYHVVSYTPEISWQENCYVLKIGENCFLIDPGFDCENVIDYVKNFNVQAILLTHAHHDHIASADFLSEKLNVPCVLDKADKRLLMHAPMYALQFAKRSLNRPKNILWLDEDLKAKLFSKFGIYVLNTPGHTAGSVCYFYEDIVFSGDTLIKGFTGRTDLPGSDKAEMIKSVDKFFDCAANRKTQLIYPGHGETWEMTTALDWYNQNSKKYSEHNFFN